MMKDLLIKEVEKTSGKSYPSTHEIISPSAMFMKQVIIGSTAKQIAMVNEILTRKVLQSKNSDTSFKKQYVLKQKLKIVTVIATKSKMETTIATKPLSELLKEAWTAKAKVAAQAKKSVKTTKRLNKLASPTTTILSFNDW